MEISNNQPILSIVIPTKNRYEYLEILIAALMESNSEDFELIIQDNSDDNSAFLKFLQNFRNDKRLKYNHTPGWLSVIDNCDLSVAASSGRFICMLGDDDGILLDHSVEFCKYMELQKIDASLVHAASYVWPDVKHAVWGDSISGKCSFNDFTSEIKTINLRREILSVLNTGAGFGLGKLPRVYHGFVSREVLVKLQNETGSFFPGPSPDMANAIGMTPFIKKCVEIDFPLIISGHGAKSTGGQGQRKEHHGDLKNQNFLPKDTIGKWNHQIPFFWSGHTIWAETARRALVSTSQTDFLNKELNLNYLYASCFIYENYHSKTVKAIFHNRNIFQIILCIIQTLYYIPIIFGNRLITFLNNRRKITKDVNTLENYNDVSSVIKMLGVHKINLKQII